MSGSEGKPPVKRKGPYKRKPVDERLKTPKRPGRHNHEPTPETRGLVRMLVLLGRTQDEIAAAANLDRKTLRKHYRKDLDEAYLQTGASLMQTAILKAQGGTKPNVEKADASMLRWLLERRYDIKPPMQEHRVGHYDLSKLTDEQLEQIEAAEAILASVASAGGAEGGEGEA